MVCRWGMRNFGWLKILLGRGLSIQAPAGNIARGGVRHRERAQAGPAMMGIRLTTCFAAMELPGLESAVRLAGWRMSMLTASLRREWIPTPLISIVSVMTLRAHGKS